MHKVSAKRRLYIFKGTNIEQFFVVYCLLKAFKCHSRYLVANAMPEIEGEGCFWCRKLLPVDLCGLIWCMLGVENEVGSSSGVTNVTLGM